MTNFSTRLIFAAILTISISGVCLAQGGPIILPKPVIVPVNLPGQPLYDGADINSTGITISPWGGGKVSQDDAHGMAQGGHSILVESPGFFEGGTITFAQPAALGSPTDTSRYVQISLSIKADPKYPAPPPPTDDETNPYGPGRYGRPGQGGYGMQGPQGGYGMQRPQGGYGMQGPQQGQQQYNRDESFHGDSSSLFKLAQMQGGFRPGMPGGPGPYGGQGGQGGYRGPGGPGGGYGQNPNGGQNDEDNAPPAPPAKFIHIVLTFADGTQTDVARDVPLPEDMEDWFTIGFPLSKLGIKPGAAPVQLSSISVGSDYPCLINVGRIKQVVDTSPIQASAGGEKDITVNEQAVFKAETTAGASTLSYQWDFDTNGPFVAQADGIRATHSYTKAGNYTVTLLVTDVDGIKSPVKTTSMVHVED